MRPALISLALVACLLVAPAAARADAGETHVVNDSKQTLTLACADPRVEAVINGGGNTVTLTGACTKVVINGAGNTLTIASAAKLAVNGSGNTLTVDAAGKIAITGSSNKLTWKRALSGKAPKVANLGQGNTVARSP